MRVGQTLIAFPKKVHKQRPRIQSNGQLMEKLWACAEGARLVRFAVTTFAGDSAGCLGFGWVWAWCWAGLHVGSGWSMAILQCLRLVLDGSMMVALKD